jgi:hypothetical protein
LYPLPSSQSMTPVSIVFAIVVSISAKRPSFC